MEYALWGFERRVDANGAIGLNPYSNGICSMRTKSIYHLNKIISLNPYSNGICSMRVALTIVLIPKAVLILILMEYALWG